jgi:hypothetical protein
MWTERFYDDDQKMRKNYDIFYLPEYNGWLVYKDSNNKKKTIQKGDYVFYFRNDIPYVKVSPVFYDEKKSENRILDYFVGDFGPDSERSEEEKNQVKRKGFSGFMNKPPKDLDNFFAKDNPVLYLRVYPYTLAPSIVEKFYFSNKRIVTEIKTQLGISEDFSFKDEKKSYAELRASDVETKVKFMKTLIDEIVMTTKLENDWSLLPSDEIRSQVKEAIDSIGKKIVEPSLEQLNRDIEEISEENFLKIFNEVFVNNNINLFLREADTIKSLFGFGDIPIPKEKSDYIMINFKHHLVEIIYLLITDNNLTFQGFQFDKRPYMLDLLKFYDKNQEQDEFIENLRVKMKLKFDMYFFNLWLKIYFFVSQVQNVDEILTMYMQQTIEDPGIKTILNKGLIKNSDIETLRNFFIYENYIYGDGVKEIEIFENSQLENANMLLI